MKQSVEQEWLRRICRQFDRLVDYYRATGYEERAKQLLVFDHRLRALFSREGFEKWEEPRRRKRRSYQHGMIVPPVEEMVDVAAFIWTQGDRELAAGIRHDHDVAVRLAANRADGGTPIPKLRRAMMAAVNE